MFLMWLVNSFLHQNTDTLFDYAKYKYKRKTVTNFRASFYKSLICKPIGLREDVMRLYCHILANRWPLVLKLILLKLSVKLFSTPVSLASHSDARKELHSKAQIAYIAAVNYTKNAKILIIFQEKLYFLK